MLIIYGLTRSCVGFHFRSVNRPVSTEWRVDYILSSSAIKVLPRAVRCVTPRFVHTGAAARALYILVHVS